MKANTKASKKPSLDYYDNEEFKQIIENVDITAGELSELIEERIENMPVGGLYKIRKYEVNKLIDKFNSSFGHIYKHVK